VSEWECFGTCLLMTHKHQALSGSVGSAAWLWLALAAGPSSAGTRHYISRDRREHAEVRTLLPRAPLIGLPLAAPPCIQARPLISSPRPA
jgi:hypothetical protein